MPRIHRIRPLAGCLVLVATAAACGSTVPATEPLTPIVSPSTLVPAPVIEIVEPGATPEESTQPTATEGAGTHSTAPAQPAVTDPLFDPANAYAAAGANLLSDNVAGALPYVYVPSTDTGEVVVIDQNTYEIVHRFNAGKLSQHVVPAWDMKTLYVNASGPNKLVPIDPLTGLEGPSIPVDAPYNLYFAPDGSSAIVMAERRNRIDFYDPVTWQRTSSLDVPCKGVNHADWTAGKDWFLVSCEFSGTLLQINNSTHEIMLALDLPPGSAPQDVRLVPDGSKFYVADMEADGVWIVSATTAEITGFIRLPAGTHGIYPSRDGTLMYVTNRGRGAEDHGRHSRDGEGGVSVIDPTTDLVVAEWLIPGGGSPDMGGVSADGTKLWLSGRFDDKVYVFDTTTGALITEIPVSGGPHGLAVWPQPGTYSLGHTGNTR
jgi:YVTN family beta-propeller protein